MGSRREVPFAIGVALLLLAAGCSVPQDAVGVETDAPSRDASVLVESRIDPPDEPIETALQMTDGNGELVWNESEVLVNVEYFEQSIVLGRDGEFDLTVSVASSTRTYVWNTTACRHFRIRATVAPNGSVATEQFCGRAWLREF